MTITLNPWALSFLIGITIGLLLVVLLIAFARRFNPHVQNITLVLLILIGLLFSEFVERVNIEARFQFFVDHSISLDLLLWPFLLFYTQYITGHRNKYSFADILWFIPVALGLLWNEYILSNNFMNASHKGISDGIAHFVTFKFGITLIFLSLIVVTLWRKVSILKELLIHISRDHPTQKVLNMFKLLSTVIIIIYLTFFINYFQLLSLPDSDDIGSLIISGILFGFALLMFKNPLVVDPNLYSPAVKKFFDQKEHYYATRLLGVMQNEQPYLDPELNQEMLASRMGLATQQFSYLLNRYLGVTFSDFINSYRVKRMQDTLLRDSEAKTNLLKIAFASGFNSKASMNRIFKSQTGQTPTEFLKNN